MTLEACTTPPHYSFLVDWYTLEGEDKESERRREGERGREGGRKREGRREKKGWRVDKKNSMNSNLEIENLLQTATKKMSHDFLTSVKQLMK